MTARGSRGQHASGASTLRPPTPADEDQRLAVLHRHGILDTPRERAFDRVTEVAARVFRVPICLVSLVDEHRQWFKACIGIEASETSRDVAFCAHAILQRAPLVVPDATKDARFVNNPLVTGPPRVRFYAGAPLVTHGHCIGTLCLIDTKPRTLDDGQLETLTELAAMVVDELELREVKRELETRTHELVQAMAETEKQREAALYQQAVLKSVLDSAAEGIVVADERGRFRFVNPSAKQILGIAEMPSYTEFQSQLTVLHPDGTELDPAHRPLARAMRGESCDDMELLLRVPAREDMIVSLSSRPLRGVDRAVGGGGVVTFRDVTELRKARLELARLATTDGLTGLPNKRVLDERLMLLVAEANRGRRFAVVMIDVDHFKKVNDTHGHAVGDKVLVAVASALRARLRATDLVARYGGEELCALVTDVDAARAAKVAEDLRAAIEAIESPVQVTASFGVCATESAPADAATLMKAADDALYRAKREGRNRVVVHG